MASILNVDKIRANGSTTDGLTIDSSGRVFLPQVPSWRVSMTGDQSITTTGSSIIEWDNTSTQNCFLQGGITLSSYQVVVPVAGVYQCNFNVRVDGIGSGYVLVQLIRQNTVANSSETYVINGNPPTNYISLTGSEVYNLDASDNMKVTVYSSGDSSFSVTANSTFSGHLVG